MIVNLAELRRQYTSPRPPYLDPADPARRNRLSLEQQKKRAKDLLHEWRSGDAEARKRFQRHCPESISESRGPRLHDAQQVLARENGFRKWTDLKAHIERIDVEWQATIEGRPSALDAAVRTLHIRCGQDIQHDLALAGFSGDFLSFPDPYVDGPVPRTKSLEDFVRIRAEYLDPGNPEAFEEGMRLYRDLERAREYPAVHIWMELDPFDQLILARLLWFFHEASNRPARLRMINVTHFPGFDRFVGLGQLPPQALRVLWDDFENVTEAQLSLGARVWDAITSPSPESLMNIVNAGTPAIPTMGPDLARHLRELPSVHNGLGMTEELTLKILSDKGPMTAGKLWGWYNGHYEPMPFRGDTSYWSILEALSNSDEPALHIDPEPMNPQSVVELLPFGERLLRREEDWLKANPAERWVGGVRIDPQQKRSWRFDVDRSACLLFL